MNSKFWGAAVCSVVILQAAAGGCKASCWCGGAGGIQIFQIFRMSRWHGVAVRDRLVGALLTLFLGQAGRFRWLFLSVNLADMRGHFPRSREAECPLKKIFWDHLFADCRGSFGWSDALIFHESYAGRNGKPYFAPGIWIVLGPWTRRRVSAIRETASIKMWRQKTLEVL